jgi:hypothetical protein
LPSSGSAPNLLFDGFSAAVRIDGNDHLVPIALGWCGSCAQLPPPCRLGGPCVPQNPACAPSVSPGGNVCCPRATSPACIAPGARCADGSTALVPPGGCCAVCVAPAT